MTATEREDAVSQCIGEFGRWQLLMTFLLALFNFPCTFHIFALTFEAAPEDFRCAKPSYSSLTQEQWLNVSTVTGIVGGKLQIDGCRIKNLDYRLSYEELLRTEPNDTRPCSSWDYDTSQFGETIITEWNLVCEQSQLSNIAEMMFLTGVAIGGFVCGLFSDKFGRKTTLMVSLLAQIIIGVAIAFTPWYSLFLVFRFILGMFSVSVVFSGFVLCMELVGGKWLTISGVSYLFPLPLGYITISGIAYFIKGWRSLQLAITLPALVFLPLWWVLPESPRWLLTMCQGEKVITVLKKAAKFNGKELPANADKILKQSMARSGEQPPKVGCLDLFRTAYMRKISLLLYVVWFSVYLVYYGLVLNLSNLGGDVYVNSIISGAVEFPAIAVSILFLLKMGRRWPLSLTTAGAGIACLMTVVVKNDDWLRLALAMVGRLCISSSNVVMPVFTAELFPTSMRNLGVGSSNAPAGVALILVPYLWNMAGMNENMPMAVLGLCGLLGGAAVLLLPETGGLVEDVGQT
ncbi:organic cation transporter protein isoform X2 [Halyomorpha halys]|nr:organic cation transporter protein-like isoform X2 [Halyomorpha halys]